MCSNVVCVWPYCIGMYNCNRSNMIRMITLFVCMFNFKIVVQKYLIN